MPQAVVVPTPAVRDSIDGRHRRGWIGSARQVNPLTQRIALPRDAVLPAVNPEPPGLNVLPHVGLQAGQTDLLLRDTIAGLPVHQAVDDSVDLRQVHHDRWVPPVAHLVFLLGEAIIHRAGDPARVTWSARSS